MYSRQPMHIFQQYWNNKLKQNSLKKLEQIRTINVISYIDEQVIKSTLSVLAMWMTRCME